MGGPPGFKFCNLCPSLMPYYPFGPVVTTVTQTTSISCHRLVDDIFGSYLKNIQGLNTALKTNLT